MLGLVGRWSRRIKTRGDRTRLHRSCNASWEAQPVTSGETLAYYLFELVHPSRTVEEFLGPGQGGFRAISAAYAVRTANNAADHCHEDNEIVIITQIRSPSPAVRDPFNPCPHLPFPSNPKRTSVNLGP